MQGLSCTGLRWSSAEVLLAAAVQPACMRPFVVAPSRAELGCGHADIFLRLASFDGRRQSTPSSCHVNQSSHWSEPSGSSMRAWNCPLTSITSTVAWTQRGGASSLTYSVPQVKVGGKESCACVTQVQWQAEGVKRRALAHRNLDFDGLALSWPHPPIRRRRRTHWHSWRAPSTSSLTAMMIQRRFDLLIQALISGHMRPRGTGIGNSRVAVGEA